MKIHNPSKNTFVDLHSTQGIQLLKKYIKNYQNGGSGTEATATAETAATTAAETAAEMGDAEPTADMGGEATAVELPKYGSCEGYNSPGQFDACTKDIVVVFLGGFHPFHRGHYLSYLQAKNTFGEEVCRYVVASNSNPKRKTGNKTIEAVRPFPFESKKELAILSGVRPEEILCDTQPMTLKNTLNKIPHITDKLLIIVRSKKEEEEELITNENAIEKMTTNILKLKSNNKAEKDVRIDADIKFREFIDKYNPSMNRAYYKIAGKGNNKTFTYDFFQPIPDECYEIDGTRNKKFILESIDTLKSILESINTLEIIKETNPIKGFVHITTTEPIRDGEMDLSSGTKIRRAYINASSKEEKKRILSILYPGKTEEVYDRILEIYDMYLNETFFDNYKKTIAKARKSAKPAKPARKSAKPARKSTKPARKSPTTTTTKTTKASTRKSTRKSAKSARKSAKAKAKAIANATTTNS